MPIQQSRPVAPAISEYDHLREIKANKPSFFIIQARDIFSSIRVPLATAWEDLVVNVSKSNSLAQANFVRMTVPKTSIATLTYLSSRASTRALMFFNPEARPD